MEKINFVNNSTPALNSTNLNKLQDNIEDSIKSQKTLSDTDTYSCNYINQNNTYSTSETLTGKTWIDGKPIYRKVLSTGPISGTTIKEISLPSQLGTLLPTLCGILFDNAGNGYPVNYNNIYNIQQDIGLFAYISSGKISIKCQANFNITSGYIVIEYTKTND